MTGCVSGELGALGAVFQIFEVGDLGSIDHQLGRTAPRKENSNLGREIPIFGTEHRQNLPRLVARIQ